MDVQTEAYIQVSGVLDDLIVELVDALEKNAGSSLICEVTGLAKVGLESGDRLTVLRTQARVLMFMGELINGQRLVWDEGDEA